MARKLLYQGKAKSLYTSSRPKHCVMHFRDDATAFDGAKHALLARKGMINNHFNAFIMRYLAKAGIQTHFARISGERESLVKQLEMIPVECVVRNIATGSLCRRLGIEEGKKLEPPIFEFFYKSDLLHDPMINEWHITTLGWASLDEARQMRELTLKVNEILIPLFKKVGLLLVDYKLEFGRYQGSLVLGDEFTPDGARIWDSQTNERLDKDRFRKDLGCVIESYEVVAARLRIPLWYEE